MNENLQALLWEIQKLLLRCADHDRPILYADSNKACAFRSGWASRFHLSWTDNRGEKRLFCYLDYPDICIDNLHIREDTPPMRAAFLTREMFHQELVPALEQWLTELVAADEYGGLYGGSFGISMTFDLRRGGNESPGKVRWYQAHIRVQSQQKLDTAREKVRQFIRSGAYKDAALDADEYYACVEYIGETACSFLDELGLDTLKEFFDCVLQNARQSRFDSTTSNLVQGMTAAGFNLLNQEDSPPTAQQLELVCFIGLKALIHATDKYEYKGGSELLKSAAAQGSTLAKEIMKFGSGLIDRQFTHHKDKQLECIANDVEATVEFRIKEESAAVYETAVRFLTTLLQQGFPAEYKIKCNTKVKQYIDTDLRPTKTNNFFANAAAFPEVHPALRDHARAAFDAYSYYTDADAEQAVSGGGYPAMALAFADPEGNFDIALEFLEQSDFEHALTSRYFAQDFADRCKGERKKQLKRYLREF